MATKDNTPLIQLTVGELVSILERKIEDKIKESTVSIDSTKKEYEYGIVGLAKILGCSKTSAQRYKSSGIFDEAISQTGRSIVIDKQKVLEIMNKR